ncbi:hypothetical protein QTP88_006689 [Uroleucon formosanum]
MAGSIADNAALYKKKSFVYVPPTTPSDLIQSTSITLDFAARKFIHIGLDPTEDFDVIIRILTSSRYVHVSYYTLKRIFSMMGNILSFILNTPEKYNRTIFLDTETEKLSSMVYGGENVLVVESKNREGCRVLLNRSDLIRLQYLEGTIFEIIHLTTTYTHTLLSKQVRAYIMYLEKKFSQMQSPPVNEEEIIMFIKRNIDCQLVQSEPILTSQIRFFAAAHVAARLIERKTRNSPLSIDHHDKPWTSDGVEQPCDENDGPDFFRALSPSQFITPPTFTFAPRIDHQCDIQIAPQIFVPDIAAGGSNMVSSNETCIIIEDEDTDYITIDNGKRVSIANTVSAARAKKARIEMVRSRGLREISTSANRKIVWYYAKNMDKVQNYNIFLNALKSDLTNVLETHVKKNAIKFNLKLEATYNRPNVENSSENRAFKTSAVELFRESDILALVEESFTKLLTEEEAYTGRGSGFTLESIDGLLLGVYKYTPMSGSSYISLPDSIDRKKGTINPQNNDQQCFKWSILAKHVTEQTKCRIGKNYRKHEGKYIFDGISFPTPLSDIKIFEKNNPFVSINIFGIEKRIQPPKKFPTYKIFPLRVVEDEKRDHFDLLLMTENDNTHYIYISNFSRLIRSQKTRHTGSFIFCKRCFTSFDHRPRKYQLSGQAALEQHKLICGSHKPILPVMPTEGDCLQFDAWRNTQRHPIVIYADFEALLLKTDGEKKGKNTDIIHKHEPMSFGIFVKASNDVPLSLLEEYDIPIKPIIYRGSEERGDVAARFVEMVTEISLKIEKLLKTNIMINMSAHDRAVYEAATRCNLCCIKFTPPHEIRHRKTADHCHLSGKYRQALCNICNQKLQTPVFVPCFLHNLSNYDAHFIVTELGYDTHRITVIPNSEEKFISFSKYISNTFTVRFIDTCRFMASKLSTLAKNLLTLNFSKFRETGKHFSTDDMNLVTRKGVYPYEYTDAWNKLEENALPDKSEFYSILTESGVEDKEYEHAMKVWEHFGCKTIGEYSDLYLKIDVLLLSDIFENFRDVCMKTYNLDPAYYYTAPGFSFDCMLKYTSMKLELVSDYDMLMMFENGIRGGLVQASMRYAKANNEKTSDYDDTKEDSWLVYQDCNNLYGWAMSQYMPYGGFKWVEPNLEGLNDLDDNSPIGRIYEVNVSYPKNLHDVHNDLPFLPQNGIPAGSKVKKLMATFKRKTNYVIHYRNLQQAIANGLIVEKVHRVVQFDQSPWLAEYISLNTEMRKNATNEFEREFFKLMNNAVFGKTMESVRKRIQMELVSNDRRLQKLINKCTFKHSTSYNENLNAVSLENKIIEFSKPIYIGFSVLDISKTLMYDYHYNVMKKHYGDNIKLMYTDTDSLVYHINTKDFYRDLTINPNLLDRMDTSDLPKNHPCYIAERKKIPGLFSDETKGAIMTDFCALRAKSYSFILAGKEKIKAKGIKKHVLDNHMTFNDHKKCLFGMENMDVNRENVSIRSFKHKLMTIKTNKITLNNFDDKRVVLEDKIHTLAHGHYRLEENELEDEETIEWPDHEIDASGREWEESEKDLMRLLLQEMLG